jgi:hypothetical protein
MNKMIRSDVLLISYAIYLSEKYLHGNINYLKAEIITLRRDIAIEK